jgi:DNA polymerase III delta prime subunit
MVDSLKASEQGLKIVDEARRRKHLQKYALKWATVATTSQATLKRFWRKCAIERSNFIAICQAVGVNWEQVAEANYAEEIEQILLPISPIFPGEHPDFANISVGAKHSGSKSLVLTNNLSAGMLRPYKIGMLPFPELYKKVIGYEQTKSFALPEKIAPVRNWVGRSHEINTLKSQILDPETRTITITAVCLVGLAGIGKTTLASQLIRQLQAENAPFTVAAWETLRSPTGKAPRFDSIIDSLLLTLSHGEISAATTQNDYRQKTEILLKLLKQKPCLVVLDNVETVLQTGQAQKTGYFADDCFEYLWLFKHIVETEHQSKVIFTSRESLAALSAITVRELRLNGLEKKDAVNLLESHQQCLNLTTTSEELAELAERYQGHPKALEIVSALIRDEPKFNGQVGKFLRDRQWLLINTLDQLIEEVFIRLSDLERTCLSRISVYQTAEYPLDTAGIAAQMPEVSEYELEESIIQGLRRRQLLDYDDQQKSYQIHPLIQEKAHRLLQPHPKIVTSESLFANRQAYRYFLGIPLKPDTEWQEIEDIKPLLRAHYHACCAADWDEAATAISGIYGFYFQILRALYLKLIPTDWKDGKQLVNLPEVHADIFQYLGLACCQLGELQLGIKSLSVSFSTPSEEISSWTIPSTSKSNIIIESFSNSASNQEISISGFISSDVTGCSNLGSSDPQPLRLLSSTPIEMIDDGFTLEDNIILDNAVGVDDIINANLMGMRNYNSFQIEDARDEVKSNLIHGNSIAGIGCDKDYNDIMINLNSKTRYCYVSLDYLQQSLVIARKIAAIEIESKTLVIEEPKQYYLGDYYLGMANFKEALKIARQIGYNQV